MPFYVLVEGDGLRPPVEAKLVDGDQPRLEFSFGGRPRSMPISRDEVAEFGLRAGTLNKGPEPVIGIREDKGITFGEFKGLVVRAQVAGDSLERVGMPQVIAMVREGKKDRRRVLDLGTAVPRHQLRDQDAILSSRIIPATLLNGTPVEIVSWVRLEGGQLFAVIRDGRPEIEATKTVEKPARPNPQGLKIFGSDAGAPAPIRPALQAPAKGNEVFLAPLDTVRPMNGSEYRALRETFKTPKANRPADPFKGLAAMPLPSAELCMVVFESLKWDAMGGRLPSQR
jgi:hypothetical protein